MLEKNLKYSLYETYIKWFCNVPEEKYLLPLRILDLFIKSFVNPFVDIASTFFDSSFNLFSLSTCFALFNVILFQQISSITVGC